MRRSARPRKDRPDLLTRPPCRPTGPGRGWEAMVFDPVAPLTELARLLDRGLITRAEYERQKAKVIGEPVGATSGAGSSSYAEQHQPPRRAIRLPACGRSSSGGT